MNQRLLHDCSHPIALHLLDAVRPCLREEEWRDAYAEFYGIVRAGLEAYEEHRLRAESRLRPAGD